jgi:hypothetical protein
MIPALAAEGCISNLIGLCQQSKGSLRAALRVADKPIALKGHGFIRAAKSHKMIPALELIRK